MEREELRTTNALNDMRARRFGGAVNYARTPKPAEAVQPARMKVDEIAPVTQHYEANPVQAPAVNIGTMKPAVPNVQPTAPVTPTQQTAPTAPVVQTRPVAPVQPTAQQMPARPGVTADPMTNPYAYIEQMYGPRETLEERQARERREYNNQRIANWVSMLGALGNTEWLQMREAVDAGTAGVDEYGE